MTTITRKVVAGVDTHADTHHVAVVDTAGRKLGDAQFPATGAGYTALLAFVLSFGVLLRIGVEGTGSYGAGLARYLRGQRIEVAEVIRPNRQIRRMRGKSDPIDAYAAATTVLAEPDLPVPKTADGNVEAIRQLMVARRSAVKARTAAQVQIKTLLVTAPEQIRAKYRGMTDTTLIATLSRTRGSDDAAVDATLYALRSLARRHQHLTAEITDLETPMERLASAQNPALAATKGIGPVTAAQLLVTAGDNPGRLSNEAAFAALCGVSPVPASSGLAFSAASKGDNLISTWVEATRSPHRPDRPMKTAFVSPRKDSAGSNPLPAPSSPGRPPRGRGLLSVCWSDGWDKPY